jgi:ATP phosphoribosyltransferase
MITIAVAKGYLLKETIKLLDKEGFVFDEDLATTRKLFIIDKSESLRILLVRPTDVPVYVEQGAADLGVSGKDTLLELKPNILTLLDLKFGYCKLIIAGPTHMKPSELKHNLTVASKFTACAAEYFKNKGLKANIIKLYGSIELAPITGLSDIICDLTATGTTLKENKLHIIDTLFESTAHLIANPVSFRVHDEKIRDLVKKISKHI